VRRDHTTVVSMEALRFSAGILILCLAYPLGATVGRIATGEVKKAQQYLLLARDVFFLAAVAVAAYAHGETLLQYVLPAAIITSYFWFWKSYERIYPFLLPLVLAASLVSRETLILNGTLLCMCAFTGASVGHSSLRRARDYLRYWPVAAVGAALVLLLLFL